MPSADDKHNNHHHFLTVTHDTQTHNPQRHTPVGCLLVVLDGALFSENSWKRFNASSASPTPAPLLPNLTFTRCNIEKHELDMNGSENRTPPCPNTTITISNSNSIPTSNSTMPSFTTPRNVSGPLAIENQAMTTDPNAAAPWTRPNFHTTPGNSKTSQYIDKITSENDRLRRELKAEKLAREDEAKRVSAARSKAEDSRADFQHLQVLADTNARAIERKDRKLDELKATLEAEAKRRKIAEQRAEEALKMLGDTRSETQRQLSQAYEMKHMADTNLETARDGFKRITDGYEKKLKHINEELHQLRKHRIQDADKIKRQAIISDQLHHEMSRTMRTETNLSHAMQTYKDQHREEMDALVAEAAKMRATLPQKEKEAEELVESMRETRDKMKWVMTQKRRQGDS
ncbi:hypothetical protein GQ44DRAFT_696220 [Phaeosphaeriaceae sp. PMI808]|nr:hypothetical protein GQ44DRAFT_696220 [Phaeosphaeriaceae sp. PMI808]